MSGPDSYTAAAKQQSSQTAGQEKASNKWTFFCDFPYITHIALNDANVSIFTQDNGCLVRVLAYLLTSKPETACEVPQLKQQVDITPKRITNA